MDGQEDPSAFNFASRDSRSNLHVLDGRLRVAICDGAVLSFKGSAIDLKLDKIHYHGKVMRARPCSEIIIGFHDARMRGIRPNAMSLAVKYNCA